MSGPSTTIDVGELLETRPLGRFHILVAVLGFVVLMVDGLDFSAGMVSAPSILRAFGADRAAMGNVFGAGSAGALLGALFFGYIADRYGPQNRHHLVRARLQPVDPGVGLCDLARSAHGAALPHRDGRGRRRSQHHRAPDRDGAAAVPRELRHADPHRHCRGKFHGRPNRRLVDPVLWLAGWCVRVGGSVGLLLSVLLAFALPELIRSRPVAKPDGPS